MTWRTVRVPFAASVTPGQYHDAACEWNEVDGCAHCTDELDEVIERVIDGAPTRDTLDLILINRPSGFADEPPSQFDGDQFWEFSVETRAKR